METKFRVILHFEDGSKTSVVITTNYPALVCQIARGWLMASSIAISVEYYMVDECGRNMGYGGAYVS